MHADQRCVTCKYWEPAAAAALVFNATLARLRGCEHPAFLRGPLEVAHAVTDDGALVEPADGWGILTGPQFGCVHWQALHEERPGEPEAEP